MDRKIIHRMADGTIRNSIKGYPVELNEKTEVAYKILINKLHKNESKQNVN